ncbi:MAG: LD-carboxypeptidase [Synergistaceae bacterium]
MVKTKKLLILSIIIFFLFPLCFAECEVVLKSRPQPLRRGSRVAIMSLASPFSQEAIEKSAQIVREYFGYEPVLYPSSFVARGYLTGKSDEAKAKELESAFKDPQIDGIICIKGGYGSQRIIKYLNHEVIKANPKVFMGFSDITALLGFLDNKCNMVTFHGPMTGTISRLVGKSEEQKKATWLKWSKDIIENPNLLPCKLHTGKTFIKIHGGKAEGEILGGNLTILASLVGTANQVNLDGKIVFFEDVGEDTYKIERMLIQLRDSGSFDNVRGFILGSFTDCKQPKGDQSIREIIDDVLVPLGKPIIAGVRAGHGKINYAIPFGVLTEIDGDKGTITFIDKALKTK